MKIPIVFCGGVSDSNLPRKANIAECGHGASALRTALFFHSGWVDCDVISPEDYIGSEACSKCLRAVAAETLPGDQEKWTNTLFAAPKMRWHT